MNNVVQHMTVWASDGEKLGRVGNIEGSRFVLVRDGHAPITIFPWQVRNVGSRGVELWLARAELPPPIRVAQRGVDEWGNRIQQPDHGSIVTASEFDDWKRSH